MENNYTFDDFLKRVKKYAFHEFEACTDPEKCIDEAIRNNYKWLKSDFDEIGDRYPGLPKLTKEIFNHCCKDTASVLRWMW